MTTAASASPAFDDALVKRYADKIRATGKIDPDLYEKYNVKRGLRNADGTGVLVGLTAIGSVHGYMISESEKVSVPGQLFYRGINVNDLVKGFQAERRPGFEETAYLLLFGELPGARELQLWNGLLDTCRRLPDGFKERAIIRSPGKDIMNSIARAVLTAYLNDPAPDRLDVETTLRQSISLIAQFPVIAAYAYQAKAHYHMGQSLMMRYPETGKSTAENFLMLMREDGLYSPLEAELLDLCLVLHAEHGGGNNSTFTTHVVSSTFTDTYSAIAAAILSLKGPRHGGANLQVCHMMADIKANVKKWDDRNEVTDYLRKILNKEAFDRSGLIYGLGHAVYKVSDPRAEILKDKAAQLVAENKEFEAEFNLYNLVAEIGVQLFLERSKTGFGLCVNVDFYSGFVYKMLGIPVDLFTPLFAIGRMPGWAAHRLEELNTGSRIIRPAYKCIQPAVSYVPIAQRG